ncbi:MAG: AraC family transcriptional regulator [Verrucomicrobia bacterium]|nr:AraC family transcriptional regulator [Verrucomicrobiota bacterium]
MKDYFVYLPDQNASSIWGCAATSAGFARVPPHSPYPPHRHPVDHHFTWSQGRVLQAYQIVFVSEGRGLFESAVVPKHHSIEAGTVLLLFPGVWHRYAPNPETGWVEHWIECRGSAFDEAARTGLIQPRRAVIRTGLTPDLLHPFDRLHTLAQRGGLANHDMLSTLGLHLLSAVARSQREERGLDQAIDDVVERGHALIALRCQEPLNLNGLASELGVSYSHFRHAFKARLGVSPKQYHLQVRLNKAQDLLANTVKPLKEVAEILGFESAFHLSKQFKKRVGQAPSAWRETAVAHGRDS